jgi:DMSO/TMAO reductase YedYZ heme-binding membrane subunit
MKSRAVTLVWLAAILTVGVCARGDHDAYSRALALTRALGLVSFGFLALALCATPVMRLLHVLHKPMPQLRASRRALGLAAVGGGLLHAFSASLQSPLQLVAQYEQPALRWGMGALLMLCALGVTSFASVLRRLRLSTWKELHRLAYVAFACAAVHALLMPFAWTLGLLGVCAFVIVFGLLRALPRATSSREPAADP